MTLNDKLFGAIFDPVAMSAAEFCNAARGADSVHWDGKEFRGVAADGKPVAYKKRDNPLGPTEGWVFVCDAQDARAVYEDEDLLELLSKNGVAA